MATRKRDEAVLRIGEIERRTGVAAGTLRAWQRRYGLLRPERTAAGYRLYSEADVERVLRVRRLLQDGLAISDAARLVGDSVPDPGGQPASGLEPDALIDTLVRFDGEAAQGLLDDLMARFRVSSVAVQVVLPALRHIGEQQASGELGIGHEHFASNLIRGRLWGLTRSWDQGGGKRAVLACSPGDHHDLGLLIFGIALRERGWRITYLGIDTPALVLADIVAELDAEAAVVSFTINSATSADVGILRDLASRTLLAVGGRAASQRQADDLGAALLDGDPVAAAAHECFARP